MFLTAVRKSGSSMTARKLSRPTHVGASTRFVSWSEITTRRTIGYHENSPKMTSIGSSEDAAPTARRCAPSRRGVRRAPAPLAGLTTGSTPSPSRRRRLAAVHHDIVCGRVRRRHLERRRGGRPAGRVESPRRPAVGEGYLASSIAFWATLFASESSCGDVRVPVGEDGLHDRVERVVHGLRRDRRLGVQALLEDPAQ